MEDMVKAARIAGMRKAQTDRVMARLRQSGRLDFGVISRTIVKDAPTREWVIRSIVESGLATIEVDYATGGRPRTVLVLKE